MPLLAVHIADGVLSDWFALGGCAAAMTLVFLSAVSVTEEDIPRIGVLSATFFVASQIHIPLLMTSVHLLLNGLVAVLLGRRAAIAIAVGLFLQAFLFGHGGWLSLGVNVCVYAWPAMVAGCLFQPIRRTRMLPDFALGCLFGLATAAVTVGLNFAVLMFAGKEDWSLLAKLVLLANLPVILVEGIGVGFAVQYLGKVKPEWLGGNQSMGNTSSNGTSH